MNTLNITKAVKKMSAKGIRDFIYEDYYKRIEFSKEDSYCSFKGFKKKKEKKKICCLQTN